MFQGCVLMRWIGQLGHRHIGIHRLYGGVPTFFTVSVRRDI
jgi:hypothetical protein